MARLKNTLLLASPNPIHLRMGLEFCIPADFVYIYGALAERPTPIPVLEMIPRLPTIKGYSLWMITGDEKRRPLAVRYIVKVLTSGALKPVIDRVFKFDEMANAHRYLEGNEQFGKIVVMV